MIVMNVLENDHEIEFQKIKSRVCHKIKGTMINKHEIESRVFHEIASQCNAVVT